MKVHLQTVVTALQNDGDYAAWSMKRRLVISYLNFVDEGVSHMMISVSRCESGRELTLLFRANHSEAPTVVGPFGSLSALVQCLKTDHSVPLLNLVSVGKGLDVSDESLTSKELVITGNPADEEYDFNEAAPIDVSMQGYELAFETGRWGPMKSLAPLLSRQFSRTDRMFRHVVFIVEFTQVGRRGCCTSPRVLRKRFRQFKELHTALQSKISHLPALPHTRLKRVVSNSAYICRKMQSLESYLQNLVKIPMVATTKSFTCFCLTDHVLEDPQQSLVGQAIVLPQTMFMLPLVVDFDQQDQRDGVKKVVAWRFVFAMGQQQSCMFSMTFTRKGNSGGSSGSGGSGGGARGGGALVGAVGLRRPLPLRRRRSRVFILDLIKGDFFCMDEN